MNRGENRLVPSYQKFRKSKFQQLARLADVKRIDWNCIYLLNYFCIINIFECTHAFKSTFCMCFHFRPEKKIYWRLHEQTVYASGVCINWNGMHRKYVWRRCRWRRRRRRQRIAFNRISASGQKLQLFFPSVPVSYVILALANWRRLKNNRTESHTLQFYLLRFFIFCCLLLFCDVIVRCGCYCCFYVCFRRDFRSR